MKKSLVFLAAITLAFGAVSVIATDKKPADSAATPAAPAAATPAAAPAAAPAADSTAAPAAAAKKQTICPKCKSKIAKKYYLDADGKRIYFCGSICAAKAKKDIAGVVSKLEADGITLDTVEKKVEKEKKK